MKKTKLRPYQEELIEKIKAELKKGKKSVCAVLGCGGGKSIIQGMIAKSATNKGSRVLFLVHRKELCTQIEDTFRLCGVDFDLCDIMMVQTATRRLGKITEPSIIITDEAHHCLSNSYIRIYEYFSNALKLGFTATPVRMNEGGLGKVFDSLVESVSTKWLIDNNYLSPYKYFSVKLADTKNLHTARGDYDSKEVAKLMENNYIYGETIKNYLKIAKGKKTIVYCASIKSSLETVSKFKTNGIRAEHVDGTTPKNQREQIINDFRNGEIDVLSNVDLFGEGFDVPDCECVILLRPTKSLTLFIQQSMRSMRYKENKTAVIIDHVGNVFKHGFPDDKREWSLKTKKKKAKGTIIVKQCPVCFACLKNTVTECTECGYIFPKAERTEKETVSAELTEISKSDVYAVMPYESYTKLKTFEELREFQRARKYKFGWVIRKAMELHIPIPDKYDMMVRRFFT